MTVNWSILFGYHAANSTDIDSWIRSPLRVHYHLICAYTVINDWCDLTFDILIRIHAKSLMSFRNGGIPIWFVQSFIALFLSHRFIFHGSLFVELDKNNKSKLEQCKTSNVSAAGVKKSIHFAHGIPHPKPLSSIWSQYCWYSGP